MAIDSYKYKHTNRRWLLAHALLVSSVPINGWIGSPPVFIPRNPMPQQNSFFPEEPIGARNSGLYGRMGHVEPFVQLRQDWKPSVGPFFNTQEPPAWTQSSDDYRAEEGMSASSAYYSDHHQQQPLGPNSWGSAANGNSGATMPPMGLLPGRDVRIPSSSHEAWKPHRPNQSPWSTSPSQFGPNSSGSPFDSRQSRDGISGSRYEMPPIGMEEPLQGYGYGHRRTFDPRYGLGSQSNYPRSQWKRRDEPMFNEVPWQPQRYEPQYASMSADEPWVSSWNGEQNDHTSVWESSSQPSSFGSGSPFSQPGAYDPNSLGKNSRSGSSSFNQNQNERYTGKVIEPEFYVESEHNKKHTDRKSPAFTQRTVAPTIGVIGMSPPIRSYLDTLSPRPLSTGRWKGPNFMPYRGPHP